MRFEVKGGGIAAILFAVTLLSGAVFVMGLLAGYDVGRQAQLDTAQLATSYPLQSPPLSAAFPGEPAGRAVQSAASTTASPATIGKAPIASASGGAQSLAGEPVNPPRGTAQPAVTPARSRLASASIPSSAKPPSATAASPGADEDVSDAAEAENPDTGDASSAASTNPNLQAGRRIASTAPPAHHKPFNIQIQAAMDISGADKMMARLQRLGYRSHLVPTEIAGQRWYKVEVGPYATAEEASNAEAELRQKYDSTYGGPARGNSAAPPSVNDNTEE